MSPRHHHEFPASKDPLSPEKEAGLTVLGFLVSEHHLPDINDPETLQQLVESANYDHQTRGQESNITEDMIRDANEELRPIEIALRYLWQEPPDLG